MNKPMRTPTIIQLAEESGVGTLNDEYQVYYLQLEEIAVYIPLSDATIAQFERIIANYHIQRADAARSAQEAITRASKPMD